MKRLCCIALLFVFSVCSFNNFVLAKNDYVTVAPDAIYGWAIYTDTKVQVGYISSKYVQSGMQYVVGGYTVSGIIKPAKNGSWKPANFGSRPCQFWSEALPISEV